MAKVKEVLHGENGTRHILTDAAEILAMPDIEVELVEVPEWRAAVWVRGMTGREAGRWQEHVRSGKGKNAAIDLQTVQAALVCFTVVDSDNPQTSKHVFKLTQIDTLAGKSSAAIARISKVALRLSGLSEQDAEELAKN